MSQSLNDVLQDIQSPEHEETKKTGKNTLLESDAQLLDIIKELNQNK